MEAELPSVFEDLPADAFPFTIRMYLRTTGEKVYEQTVTGPGAIMVPGFADQGGVRVTIHFGNGHIEKAE